MSEDNTKTHKINVIVTTDKEWKSDDVADTIRGLLEMDNDVEDPSFTDIAAASDPSNADTDLQDSIEGILELVELYARLLKAKVDDHKGLEMFKEGIETLEHGVVDLNACLRCARFVASKSPDIKIAKVGLDELDGAPEEVIHAIAHTLGLGKGECMDMSKEEMIDWIKNSMRGEPRTIN